MRFIIDVEEDRVRVNLEGKDILILPFERRMQEDMTMLVIACIEDLVDNYVQEVLSRVKKP